MTPDPPSQPEPVPGPLPGSAPGAFARPVRGPVPGPFPGTGQFPGPVPGGGWRGRRPRRRRHGLLKLLLVLIAVLAVVFVVPTPWALHIGGRFTPLETWTGYGPVQASNGGRYLLYTHFQGGIVGGGESEPNCSFHGCDTLFGSGKLCTRSGRTYTFGLQGGVSGWLRTDGAPTRIELTGQPLPDGWIVAFHGKWHGPALVLATPDNSFTEVFTPAGAMRSVTSTADAGVANVTLKYGSLASFASACQALASTH